ncbi:MAG: Cys-tRNA(Pro) deacylase [Oscillospiraceae bacterium]|nr:Cys-tRNA(Pro) deacylase [Oscillospiraceae bacterium]
MAKQPDKTNAMRLLDRAKIPYTAQYLTLPDGLTDGVTVARVAGVPPETAFKTLVTRGASGGYYVFVVPVCDSLHLKRAAKAAGEKSVEMIRQAALLPLTGYIHGGCSPIGMKKRFPTFLDESATAHPIIHVSAGRVGVQLSLSPHDLCAFVGGAFAAVADRDFLHYVHNNKEY